MSFLRAVAIVFKSCVRDAPRKQSTIARLTIALDALGATYLKRAAQIGMDPALLHRVAVIGSGTLDSLPHNGAVVMLLSGSTHSASCKDIFMVGIVGAIIALVVVIVLGSLVGSF